MATNLPFKFQEVFNLTSLNLNPQLFKQGLLSFESQKYISVKDGGQVAIINTTNGFSVERKDMPADSMIMHRERNVIAVRAFKNNQTVVQVYDLDPPGSKLKQFIINEQISFWRWISENKLCLVGNKSVYHADLNGNEPEKILDRVEQMSTCQIMNYDTDADGKWVFLLGLYSPDQKSLNARMQLFNTEVKQSQLLDAYAACFVQMPVTDNISYKNSLICFCQKKPEESVHKLHIMEIGNPAPGAQKHRIQVDMQMAADAAGDFPVLMQASSKYGLVFILTKFGYFFMFEASTGAMIYRQRISDQLPFVSVRNVSTDGMISINRAGQVHAINVDEANLISFISSAQHIPNGGQLAFKLASRFGLSGADQMFIQQFNQCLASGDIQGAARVAGGSPGNLLRNQETINKFKALPNTGGTPPPVVYFSTLLEITTLNELESLELCRAVLNKGQIQMVETWLGQKKLTMSDQLGDLVRQYNPNLALKIFQESGSPDRVLQGLIEANQFDKILPYCQQTGHKPDFMKILRAVVPQNPAAAVNLAKMITVRDASGQPKTPLDGVVQVFLEHQRVQETTAILLEALKGNRPDESHLQTKLFEINLMSAPNVAEGIFQLNLFTHYDKEKVAKMCEQVGLYGRALQNYTNIIDAKRVMLNSHQIPKEIMIDFFGRLNEEDSLAALHDLMKTNRENGTLVAEIAVKYASKIDTKKSIEILESFGMNQGLIVFLCNVLPHTEDPDIFFKYIEACARMNNFKEVERVIRETKNYDPVAVKKFLIDGKFSDPRPLIYLCDMHGFIEELTSYLFTSKQLKCIEIYLFKVNSNATPKVLGTLLDHDCDEVYIKQLLNSIHICPISELVDEFENRGKLRMLSVWLEARYDQRIQEPALHNALAKIKIDSGDKGASDFLIKNEFYDSKIVGKYCEERNPDLAFTAYKRAWGSCDEELIAVTNKNFLFRMQARYLVERQSAELWAKVLVEENPNRQQVIDQVVQTALPETKDVDQVAVTVSAFIDAQLPNQLIELLERIVLHNSDFAKNKDLQNLLILTAIRSETGRVMDYINRLDNYDGLKLADIAKQEEHKLFEEALCIYKKIGEHVEAVKVLIVNIQDIKLATEYADKVNQKDVWSELGLAQLNNAALRECIDAFIKAENAEYFERVIITAQNQNNYEDLIPYLLMARSNKKESLIDSEVVFAYAMGGERYLNELEDFVREPNQADVLKCGERCFEQRLYLSSEILFKRINNNQKLAQTYVMLKKYQAAYDAARKADVPRVWKAVCFACVRAKEFRMASLCGQQIIILPDHLEELIKHYERFGYWQELISLLEIGISLERTHNGIVTDLGILFARYTPERLMDHIRSYSNRLLIPKLIVACEKYQMWPEAVHLHSIYDQQDQAIQCMMEHSPTAFRHDLFSQNIINISNNHLYYTAIIFYLEEEPLLLNDLLKLISTKIDLTKAVQVMKNTGHIHLIAPFLKSVQSQNIGAVNKALNEIYIENEDFESLRASIKEYDSFESLELAVGLESHDLLECRRIAALLYRKDKKFQKSLDISKKDQLYKDMMETVAESHDPVLAEDLMRHIMHMEDKELFASMLYTCYDLIKPDVALEMAWRCDLQEFVMPYFIQFVKDLSTRVETVQKSTDDIKKKEETKAEEQMNRPLDMDVGFMFPNMQSANAGPAAIMPAPGQMPNMGGQNTFQSMPQNMPNMNMGGGMPNMGFN